MSLTLIQAQQRYIDRVNNCRPGHRNRVARAASKELRKFLIRRGQEARTDVDVVIQDARDVAKLERESED